MNLLLLSNSSSDAGYLVHARAWIEDLARAVPAGAPAVFLPFAGVTRGWDAYAGLVRDALAPLGIAPVSLHEAADPLAAVSEARLVIVGGGNTFNLLAHARRLGLMPAIAGRVRAGEAAYLGWSAGANLACPSIRTTNDMPITDPGGLDALGLVPFQINAHYTNAHPPGHRGETRDQRLAEFGVLNPETPVLALPEGTGLRVAGAGMTILGEAGAMLFRGRAAPAPLAAGSLEAFA